MKEDRELVVTPGQMSEFWRQVNIDQISREYFQDFLDHRLIKSNPFLRRISREPLIVKAASGRRIIAEATDMFPGGIDKDFRNWGADEAGSATGETPVVIYEMIKDGRYRQLFGSIDDDIEKLCFTQDQIICFIEQYPGWLRTEGFGTFFPFRSENTKFKDDPLGEFFVAYVRVYPGGLNVRVRRFENSDLWLAELRRRLVAPQPAL